MSRVQNICICIYLPILTQEKDLAQGNFSWNLKGLNLESSFSSTGCHTKIKEPFLSCDLPKARGIKVWRIPFLRVYVCFYRPISVMVTSTFPLTSTCYDPIYVLIRFVRKNFCLLEKHLIAHNREQKIFKKQKNVNIMERFPRFPNLLAWNKPWRIEIPIQSIDQLINALYHSHNDINHNGNTIHIQIQVDSFVSDTNGLFNSWLLSTLTWGDTILKVYANHTMLTHPNARRILSCLRSLLVEIRKTQRHLPTVEIRLVFTKSSNSQDHHFQAWRHPHSSPISSLGGLL